MQQNRDNITQFWVLIPEGMTAKEYRNTVKLAALQSGVSTQQFLSDAIAAYLKNKQPAQSK